MRMRQIVQITFFLHARVLIMKKLKRSRRGYHFQIKLKGVPIGSGEQEQQRLQKNLLRAFSDVLSGGRSPYLSPYPVSPINDQQSILH